MNRGETKMQWQGFVDARRKTILTEKKVPDESKSTKKAFSYQENQDQHQRLKSPKP